MNTQMDEDQKEAFLAEVKAEYHSSPDQLQRQQNDKDAGKPVGNRKRSRWVREIQRRGITHQMLQMLSFSGKWNIKFFENMPAPTQPGQCTEQQKKNTIAAAEARASVRYAKMCHHMQVTKKWCLTSSQLSLVARLRDGSLEDEAQKLTRSGNGTIRRPDGSRVNIGGSTGGFTRTVLYDWTPPDVSDL